MKIYKIIAIIVSSIIGLCAVIWYVSDNPMMESTFSSSKHDNTKEFEILKEYAQLVAQNPDFGILENISIEQKVSKDTLTVTVTKSNNYVTATFPVSSWDTKVENGNVQCNGSIDYSNVSYYDNHKTPSAIVCILIVCAFMAICTYTPYIVIYIVPAGIINSIRTVKFQGKKNKS